MWYAKFGGDISFRFFLAMERKVERGLFRPRPHRGADKLNTMGMIYVMSIYLEDPCKHYKCHPNYKKRLWLLQTENYHAGMHNIETLVLTVNV